MALLADLEISKKAHYVLKISSLKDGISFPQVKPSNTASKIPFFYSQLPTQLLNRLIRMFCIDSEMFQYDLPNSFF